MQSLSAAREPLEADAKYQRWHSQLEKNQIQLNQIDEVFTHRVTKDGDILYALLKLDADTKEGPKLNPICFLKGDAVSILVVLIAEETDDKHVLLVKQRRVCNGGYTYEHDR